MSEKLRWHLGHLDALRGIAVLGVVLVHSSLELHAPSKLAAIAFTGQRGVQLFFIVSAFTLFLSNDNRRDEHNPRTNFFLRRFFRLFPMFYIATVLACLLTPQYAGPPVDVLLSVLFIHGFTPRSVIHGAVGGWSVAIEAIFYMCLPFLFWKVRNLKTALRWLLISTPCLALGSYLLARALPQYEEFIAFFGFPVEFPVFMMGIVTYFFWKENLTGPNSIRFRDPRQISLLLLVLTAATYVMNLPFNNTKLYLSSLTCALLLISLSIYPWPFLVNRFTRFVGKISFSVYLLHIYILLGFRSLVTREAPRYIPLGGSPGLQFCIIFIATLVTTLPLAALAWRFVEEPGIHLGRLLISRLEGRALRRRDAEIVPPFEALTGSGNSPDSQF